MKITLEWKKIALRLARAIIREDRRPSNRSCLIVSESATMLAYQTLKNKDCR